ncbi:MAG: methyltransferase domain-containing protein [Myxococcota bacterium]|nr:methyltransferase domain-containing protein [Myxococcota bacterium]
MSADDELRRRRKRRALRVPVDEVPRRSAISGFPPAPEPTLAARPSSASAPRPAPVEAFDDVEELDAFEEITSELDLGEARKTHADVPSSLEEVPSDELEVEPEVAEALGVHEASAIAIESRASTSEPVASEPAASEPVVSEPVVSEPVVSEPVVSEPVASEPVASEPVASESPASVGLASDGNETPNGAAVVVVRPMVRVSSMPPPPADDFEAGELADYFSEDSGDDALPPLGAEPTRVEDSPREHEADTSASTSPAERSEPSVVVADDGPDDGASEQGATASMVSSEVAATRADLVEAAGSPMPEAMRDEPSSAAAVTDEPSSAAAVTEAVESPKTVVAGATESVESTRDSVEALDAAALSTESGETATLDLEPEDDAPELTIDDDEPTSELDAELDGELDDVDEELDLEEHEAEELAPKKAPAPPVTAAVAAVAPPALAEPEAAKVEAPPRPDPKPPDPKPRRRPWFETFFNDDYLRTVRPPKPRDIERECDFITTRLNLAPGATILDVGCGLGLHAIELTRRGYLVVGLDLSLPMLSRAGDEAQDLGLKINFLHADMREMNFDGSFDAVLCWGTTFGYFDDDSNKRVVERLHRALKPRGVLLLDVVNRDHVIRSQPNLIWFEGDGCICMEESKFNYFLSRLEVKRTVMLDDGRQRDSVYTLRSYALHELGLLLHQQGFRVAEVSGMTATPGVFFGADSPRILVVAERRVDKKDDPSRPPPPGNPSDG